MSIFIVKFWKELVLAVTLSVCALFVYEKIYERGFEKSNAEHKEYIAEYNKKLDTRISDLEALSKSLYEQNEELRKIQKLDNQKILAAAKKEPLLIQKEGKCTLSPNFIDSYNQLIDRANKK